MKSTTALAFVLASGSLWLLADPTASPRAKRTARALALATLVVTAASLASRLGWDLLDALLVVDGELEEGDAPAAMAEATTTALFLYAPALLLLDVRLPGGLRPAQLAALVGTLIGLLGLEGYIFGAGALYRVSFFSSIALHTAVVVMLFGLALLLARPGVGIVASLRGTAGFLVTTVLPTVSVATVVTAVLAQRAVRQGFFPAGFGFALATTTIVFLIAISLWYSARTLHRMERELLRTAAIVANSNDAIIAADRDLKILSWNRAATRLFGFSEQEAVGAPLSIIGSAGAAEERERIVRSVFDGVAVEPFETVRQRKDGSNVDVSLLVSPIRSEAGEVVGLSGVLRDLSHRNRANELFRRVVEAAPNAFVVVDGDGVVTLVNSETERLFGYARSELVGRPVEQLLAEDIRSYHRDLRNEFMDSPQARPGDATKDIHGRHKDGTLIPVEVGLNPIDTPDGILVMASVVDIRPRKKAELALERKNTALEETLGQQQAILSSAPVGLWALDPSGRILFAEGLLLKRLGLQGVDLVGRQALEIFPQAEPAELTRRALRGDQVHERISLNDTIVEVWYSPIFDDRGTLTRTIGVGIDLTEETRLENQFLQAQKMEVVGRLAGGIAHDFNNLLTVIGSYATLAMEGLDGHPEIRADIEQVVQAADSAARLTGQLLAFSSRQVLRPRILDLSSEVERISAMLRRLIGEDVRLETRLAPRVRPINADPGQIEQVLFNLAVNARDAMPAGGTLLIEVRDMDLDESFTAQHVTIEPGAYVMLSVSDTGVGMSEATRMSVFEPFFTTKEPGKGTGLGLATVYGIVHSYGGTIWVYSEPDQGAVFRIYLPVVAEEAETASEAPSEAAETRGETILVVEDEPGIRALIRRILEGVGYTVLVAEGGELAVAISRARPDSIDLLLSDVVMPGMNGREIADAVRSQQSAVAVLLMSGYTEDRILTHGVAEAKVDFLPKPFSRAELLRKVRLVLDAHRESRVSGS